MLHWTSGHTRQDRIRNECIKKKVGAVPIVDKMIKSRFKWVKTQVRRVDQMEGSPIVRGVVRSRKIIDQTIKTNLDLNSLSIKMDYNRYNGIIWSIKLTPHGRKKLLLLLYIFDKIKLIEICFWVVLLRMSIII